MNKYKLVLLKISLILIYTQGLWERILFFNPIVELIVELSIVLFIVFPVKNYFKKSPGYILFFIFLIIGFIVSVANGSGVVAWYKYIRFFVYFYIIYNQFWNNSINKKEWLKIFKLIVILIILQGVGAFVNIFILNQRVESYVGLMSSSGGTTATTFPLLIVSLSLLIWYFVKNRNHRINIFLFLSVLSAFLVGYSSGKRAIFLLIPIFILIITIISIPKLGLHIKFYKKLLFIGSIIILLLPIFIYGIKTSHGLNYGLVGNEDSLGIVENAIEYVFKYEEAESQDGETIGRSNTSKMVVLNSFGSMNHFLFGYGYGAIKSEETKYNIGIGYGIVGFTRDIISGGWIVMVLTVLIILKIILTEQSKRHTKFSGSFKIVLLFVFLTIHFGYSSDFTVSLKVSFIIAILCAFLYSDVHSKVRYLLVNRNFY